MLSWVCYFCRSFDLTQEVLIVCKTCSSIDFDIRIDDDRPNHAVFADVEAPF